MVRHVFLEHSRLNVINQIMEYNLRFGGRRAKKTE